MVAGADFDLSDETRRASVAEVNLGVGRTTSGRPPGSVQPGRPVTVEGVRVAIVVVGALVTLAGLLFALQGFGAVSGSPMTNTTTWSILGPIIAVIGIAIALGGWRGRRGR